MAAAAAGGKVMQEEEEKKEAAPLLRPLLHEKEDEEEELTFGRRLVEENKKLWRVAGPSIFTRFSTFGVTVISQAFIGHIGATELAGYALVSTVLNRFANGILLGMASALGTLCGQSYGAKQYHMLGIYLQRCWIILFACNLLLCPLFIFTTPILKLLGQDDAIAEMAGTIALWFIPISFSYMWTFTLQMFLQAQSRNIIITYLAAATLALHVFFSWLMVIKLNLGVAGVMGSMIMAVWLPVLGQLAYVCCGGCPQTWTGFSTAAFKDLWSVVKLSVASGVMLALELWYNTILVLLTGNMNNAEVAIDALSICLSINGWEMMIAIGFLSAAGVRVANELGAGSAKRAKFAIINVVATSFAIGVVLFVLFLVFRDRLAYIFTNSHEVAGVGIGAGWQKKVAVVNIACYYLVGIPLGAVLGYVLGFHVKGIWIGMLLGTGVQTLVLLYITYTTDWEKQVVLAKQRLNKWYMGKSRNPNENSEVD